jgi:SOS response regulatory protein OraA/RecX
MKKQTTIRVLAGVLFLCSTLFFAQCKTSRYQVKGISEKVAAEAVGKYCAPDFETAKNLAEKKAKTGASREKTMRYLLGKGFRLPVVIKAVEEIFGEDGSSYMD